MSNKFKIVAYIYFFCRNTILQTNNQLMMILSEMVRTSLDMERRIAHSLLSLDAQQQQQQPNPIPGNGSGACGGVPPGSDALLPTNPREALRRLGPGGPGKSDSLSFLLCVILCFVLLIKKLIGTCH